MNLLNIEIKAHCSDLDRVRRVLKSRNADFKGTDHQVDTYFRVPNGRLKLREGEIENCLVYYDREECEGPKESHISLVTLSRNSAIKGLLTLSLGVLAVVDKHREIYFIENVKFHLDVVSDLGTFIEIEAIDNDGTVGRGRLGQQCRSYMELLGIGPADLVASSYSDLVMSAT